MSEYLLHVFATFGQNAALFSVVLVAQSHPRLRRPDMDRHGAALLHGLTYGGVAVLSMMTPVTLAPGYFFDLSILYIAAAAIFNGPLSCAVCCVLALGYRLSAGHIAPALGLVIVIEAAATGFVFRRWTDWDSEYGVLPRYALLGVALAVAKSITMIIIERYSLHEPVAGNHLLVVFVTLTLATPMFASLIVRSRYRDRLALALVQEIGHRHHAEQSLAAKQTLIDTLFEAWPDCVYIKDTQGRYVAANRTVSALLGAAEPADLIGKTDHAFLPAAIADRLWANDQQVMTETRAIPSTEQPITTRSGNEVWLSITREPLTDNGIVIGVIGIARNITERIRYRHQLTAAIDRAKTANRAKSVFLQTMSHELRTPLNAIIGFSEMLMHDSTLSVRSAEYARDIHDAGGNLLGIVSDILDFSRMEAGYLELKPVRVELFRLVSGIVPMSRLLADKAQVGLSVEFHDPPPLLLIDEQALRRILINLVGNAIKFTPARGRVTLLGRARASRYEIAVIDTGVGIPENLQRVMFEPFRQGEDHAGNGFGSTGLGLAIVRTLANAMHATIEWESRPNYGSTFRVVLPADCILASQHPVLADPAPKNDLAAE